MAEVVAGQSGSRVKDSMENRRTPHNLGAGISTHTVEFGSSLNFSAMQDSNPMDKGFINPVMAQRPRVLITKIYEPRADGILMWC
jgi:hypothetical protein